MKVSERVEALARREHLPMIYHQFNVSIYESALGVQVKTDLGNDANNRMVILARHKNLPILTACDLVQVVREIPRWDGERIK